MTHDRHTERVLVVDDEPPIRALLARWLTGWGYGVQGAGSALEALDVMARDPADLLLCDIGMPDRDGVWLTEQVRARWPGTAVVMTTGHDEAETVRSSRKAGAAAYVLKPFNPVLLLTAIEDAGTTRV